MYQCCVDYTTIEVPNGGESKTYEFDWEFLADASLSFEPKTAATTGQQQQAQSAEEEEKTTKIRAFFTRVYIDDIDLMMRGQQQQQEEEALEEMEEEMNNDEKNEEEDEQQRLTTTEATVSTSDFTAPISSISAGPAEEEEAVKEEEEGKVAFKFKIEEEHFKRLTFDFSAPHQPNQSQEQQQPVSFQPQDWSEFSYTDEPETPKEEAIIEGKEEEKKKVTKKKKKQSSVGRQLLDRQAYRALISSYSEAETENAEEAKQEEKVEEEKEDEEEGKALEEGGKEEIQQKLGEEEEEKAVKEEELEEKSKKEEQSEEKQQEKKEEEEKAKKQQRKKEQKEKKRRKQCREFADKIRCLGFAPGFQLEAMEQQPKQQKEDEEDSHQQQQDEKSQQYWLGPLCEAKGQFYTNTQRMHQKWLNFKQKTTIIKPAIASSSSTTTSTEMAAADDSFDDGTELDIDQKLAFDFGFDPKRDRKLVAKHAGKLFKRDKEMLKYWHQRYRFFSLLDKGILLDRQSWFSVTPEKVGHHVAERLVRIKDCVLLDAFCGAGGNAIQFALKGAFVYAIDIDPVKLRCAARNARIYGVRDRINFICGDFFHIAQSLMGARQAKEEQRKQQNQRQSGTKKDVQSDATSQLSLSIVDPYPIGIDAVYLSPPWGGPAYQKNGDERPFDLRTDMDPLDGYHIFQTARALCPNIVYFLPKSTSIEQLIALSAPDGEVEMEQCSLNGKVKALHAYYGRLVQSE